MPLRVCSLWGTEHRAGLGQVGGYGAATDWVAQQVAHSPLADRLAALEVRGQVAHAVHGLHQLPQVGLDLQKHYPLGHRPWFPCPHPRPPGSRTSSMARISRRSLSITVMKSWWQGCV